MVFTNDVVDGGEDFTGQYCSLKYPGIAYYDLTGKGVNWEEGRLKYAEWNGSSWDIIVVDEEEDRITGKYASLAYDRSGRPSIGYYCGAADKSDGVLKWAWDQNGDGDFEDSYGPENEFDEITTLADGSGHYGQHVSHAIIGNSYYGFAFFEATGGDLLYTVVDTAQMGVSGVDVDTTGCVGEWCSLHFDGYTATVSYYDNTNNCLKFARDNGSSPWDCEVVDDGDGDDVGRFSSLDYDPWGNPSIAYYNVTDGDPMWARWDDEEEEWVCVHLITTEENWGMDISHQWYSRMGRVKCGFAFEAAEMVQGSPDSHLKFVRWTSEGQTTYTVDDRDDCGDYASMDWVSGDVWIAYRDFNNGEQRKDSDLRYAVGDD